MELFNEWDSASLLKVDLEAGAEAVKPDPAASVGAPAPVQQGGTDISAPAITESGGDPAPLTPRTPAENRKRNFDALTGGDPGQMTGGWKGEAARSLLNPLHLGQRMIQPIVGKNPKEQLQAVGGAAKTVAGAMTPGAVTSAVQAIRDPTSPEAQGPDWARGEGKRGGPAKGIMSLFRQGKEGGRKKQEMPGWLQAIRHPLTKPLPTEETPLLDPNTAAGNAALEQQKTQRHDAAMRDVLAGMDMGELETANPELFASLQAHDDDDNPTGTTDSAFIDEYGQSVGGNRPWPEPTGDPVQRFMQGGTVHALGSAVADTAKVIGAPVTLALGGNLQDRFAAWKARRAEAEQARSDQRAQYTDRIVPEGVDIAQGRTAGQIAAELPRDPRTNMPLTNTPEGRIAARQANAAMINQQQAQRMGSFAHNLSGKETYQARGAVPGQSQYDNQVSAPTARGLSGPAAYGTQQAAEVPKGAAYNPSQVVGEQTTPGGAVQPDITHSTTEAAAQAVWPAREQEQIENPGRLLRSEAIVAPMTGAWFQDRFGKTANDITKELRQHRRYKKAIKGEIDIAISSVRLLKRMEVEDTLETMPWLDSDVLQTLGFSERDLKSLRTASYNQEVLKNHLIAFGEAKATEAAMLKAFFEQGDWHGEQQGNYADCIQQQKLSRTAFRTTLHKEDRLTPNEVKTLERSRSILLKANQHYTANEIHANMEQKEKRNLSVQALSALLRNFGETQGIDVTKETRKSMFIVRQPDMLIKDLYSYVSGFIDGDGYITISKRFEPRVGLIATGSRGREYCIGIQKSLGYGRLMLDQKTQSEGQRSQHRLLFYSKDDIKKLLTQCKPHLRMKGGQADAVLELLKLRDFKRQDLVKERKSQLFAICKYENWHDARNAQAEFDKYGLDPEQIMKWKADGPLTLDVLEAKELVEKVIA